MPIDKAVTVLGFWICLTLLGQFQVFNPILLVTNLAAVMAFFAMESKDTEEHRSYFFYSFSIHMIASFAFMLLVLSDRTSDFAIAGRCAEMQKDGVTEAQAIKTADDNVDRSQQTGALEALPSAFTDGGLHRLWTQYLVDINQLYNNVEELAATDPLVFKNPKSYKKWAELGAFGILGPALILSMVDFGKEELFEGLGWIDNEDEHDGVEFLQDAAMYGVGQVTGTFPLFNNIIASQTAHLVGADSDAYFMQTFDPPAWSLLKEAARFDITDPDARSLALMGAYAVGQPAGSQLVKLIPVKDKKESKSSSSGRPQSGR